MFTYENYRISSHNATQLMLLDKNKKANTRFSIRTNHTRT